MRIFVSGAIQISRPAGTSAPSTPSGASTTSSPNVAPQNSLARSRRPQRIPRRPSRPSTSGLLLGLSCNEGLPWVRPVYAPERTVNLAEIGDGVDVGFG